MPGDIIQLEAGDFVPADAQLVLHSAGLKCEESRADRRIGARRKRTRTPVVAEDAAAGRPASTWCFPAAASPTARRPRVVTATGMNTEMGKIAGLLEASEETQTPAAEKAGRSWANIWALWRSAPARSSLWWAWSNGIAVLEIFMTAVSLAVSAIPEGLPAIVTIVLSIGVQRMVKKNAIIRRLPAVETLGSASVICSDKTGTLTQNRMTLAKAYAGRRRRWRIIGQNSAAVSTLLRYGALCCDGSVTFADGRHGDSTSATPPKRPSSLRRTKTACTKEALDASISRAWRSCPLIPTAS